MKTKIGNWIAGIFGGVLVVVGGYYVLQILNPGIDPVPKLKISKFTITPTKVLVNEKAKANIEIFNEGDGAGSNCYCLVYAKGQNSVKGEPFSITPGKSHRASLEIPAFSKGEQIEVQLNVKCEETSYISKITYIDIVNCIDKLIKISIPPGTAISITKGEKLTIPVSAYNECKFTLKDVKVFIRIDRFNQANKRWVHGSGYGETLVSLESGQKKKVILKSKKRLSTGRYRFTIRVYHNAVDMDNFKEISKAFNVR